MAQQQAFNLGRDNSLVLVTSAGVALQPTILTSFKFSQQTIDVKSRPLNGPPIHLYIPDGWQGDLGFDRADSILDNYFADMEEAFWNGGLTFQNIFIQQTILDAKTRAPSQYRFDNVCLKLDDGGQYEQEKQVQVKLSWIATRRRRVS